jgi:hypothetical protein
MKSEMAASADPPPSPSSAIASPIICRPKRDRNVSEKAHSIPIDQIPNSPLPLPK